MMTYSFRVEQAMKTFYDSLRESSGEAMIYIAMTRLTLRRLMVA